MHKAIYTFDCRLVAKQGKQAVPMHRSSLQWRTSSSNMWPLERQLAVQPHTQVCEAQAVRSLNNGKRSASPHALQCPTAVLAPVYITCRPAWQRSFQHVSRLHRKPIGVALQMTDENLDLNIGFRFARIPDSDSMRRSQVRWHLAMNWDDSPMAQCPRVSNSPSLAPHLTAAVI